MNVSDKNLEEVKRLISGNLHCEALQNILQLARRTDDYSAYRSLCRLRARLDHDSKVSPRLKDLKIALLGGATTDFLEAPMRLELETMGIGCRLFSSSYNSFVPEMLDAQSETVQFDPDLAVLLINSFNIPKWPGAGDSLESVQAAADRILDHWLALCEALHGNAKCEIVMSNLHAVPTRTAGNLDCRLEWETNSFIRRINEGLNQRAPSFVHILDVDFLSSRYGLNNWFDPRFWCHSKQPVSFECVVPLVRNITAIIGALYGQAAKCLVLDLDNTLWGGVVGDDGVGGLRIGQGDAESEAFRLFQEYLLRLKSRGMLLAVSSKNEENNALAPFEDLPEMLLKRSDFVSFKANWEPKPDNICAIATELNIGLEAIVFVDDNPAERELVRQTLPRVKVVELSNDPAEYPLLIDQSGWLEIARFTPEDRMKTDQYRENSLREAGQMLHRDYDSYLKSLAQRAHICAFGMKSLDRIAQLVSKTNQFNLTTIRMTRSEIASLMDRSDVFTASVSLADQFGDNGLISVMSGHIEDKVLQIDLWLMSCRVFKRGVERLFVNYLFSQAERFKFNSVRGLYIPTPKNKLVKQLYAEMGFKLEGTDESGTTCWGIDVVDYVPVPVPYFDSGGV